MEAEREKIIKILRETKVVAVVGISRDPDKSACTVPEYLQAQGYRIIPVNPNADDQTILGERVHGSLLEVEEGIDMVQVFRPSEEVPAIVEEAIAVGADFLWMQSGIVNEQAAEMAEEAGLLVVMDMCARVNHRLLSAQGKL
jgi:predicted CoA-binding protein